MTTNDEPLTGPTGDAFGPFPPNWSPAKEQAYRELYEQVAVEHDEPLPDWPPLETRAAIDPEPSNLDIAVADAIARLDALTSVRRPRKWAVR